MNRFRPYLSLALLLLLVCARPAGAQNVAVKANALTWAMATPDLGVELITGERTSVGLSVTGNYLPYGVPMKALAVTPEFRYWVAGRPLTRLFVGVAAMGTIYDITLSDMVYKGWAYGAGLTGGYVFTLGKHWAVELSAGCGLLSFKQKQYAVDDNYDDYFPDSRTRINNYGYSFAPMKLGVTFIYIIR